MSCLPILTRPVHRTGSSNDDADLLGDWSVDAPFTVRTPVVFTGQEHR